MCEYRNGFLRWMKKWSRRRWRRRKRVCKEKNTKQTNKYKISSELIGIRQGRG
jgi:ribonuclease HI